MKVVPKSAELYEFGDFRLDVGERKLERLGSSSRTPPLREKAFQTLVHLVRNRGALMTKDELLSFVWPDTIVEESNLSKAVFDIRQALGDTTGQPTYIETVPKHGYRFAAEVKKIGNGHAPEPGASYPFPGRSPAYDLYIRGKVKAGSENRQDTENAIKILEAAVAIDPFFAEAYAQLARAYNTLAFKFSSDPQRKLLHENADVAIEKALSLKPDLAEGHFARGLVLWTNTKRFPHAQAIQAYKRSLELDPTSDETHHQLSMVYAHVGLLDEAQQSVQRALEINPNNTMARYRVGVYEGWQCRFEDAIASLKTVPSGVSPMLIDRTMSEVFIQTGRLEEAKSLVDDYLTKSPTDEGGSFTSVKALLLAKEGLEQEAEDAIKHAIAIGKDFGHFHHTAYNIASAYAALDNRAKAVDWLEVAADTGFPNYTYFAIDPNLAPVRDDKRFIAFQSKLKQQWERLKALT